MRPGSRARAAALLWVLLAAASACDGMRPHDDTLHTIAFAGDTILGRSVNTLVERHGVDWPLRGLRPLLAEAELRVVNLECVVAAGGHPAGLDRHAKAYLRARPELVGVLARAGVDVASLANNHGGDYGPEAIRESMGWLRQAGIDPLGVGENLRAASAPVLRRLGDTVVAFVAAHTMTPESAADRSRPGTAHLDLRAENRAVADVARQVRVARRHADLVFLVIHWGPNNRPRPGAQHRRLARRFVREAGIDGLLGTSAHMLQGIEVIDGRPILYDAGNLVLDWKATRPFTHRSAVFLLHLSSRGVAALEVRPITLHHGYTRVATPGEATEILTRLASLSRELGTKLQLEDGRGRLVLERHPPPRASEDYRPPPRTAPRLPGPGDYRPPVIVDALPATATKRRVQFRGGVELLGHELPGEVAHHLGVNLTTYWRSPTPLSESYEITVELRSLGPDRPGRRIRRQEHQPADWMYPSTRWRPGEIVRDLYHVRVADRPAKPTRYEVSVGLLLDGRPVPVVEPVADVARHLVPLGEVTRR